MNSTDTDQAIESELIDLSTVPLDHLRVLSSSALYESIRHVLDRTACLRDVQRSVTSGGGERID
jgi:hypothetical protein